MVKTGSMRYVHAGSHLDVWVSMAQHRLQWLEDLVPEGSTPHVPELLSQQGHNVHQILPQALDCRLQLHTCQKL